MIWQRADCLMPRPQGQQQRVLTLQNRQVKCQCTANRPVDNNNNISSLRAEINKCYPPPHVIPYIHFARPHYPKNPRARAATSGSPNYSNYSQFMRCRDLWVTFRVSFKFTPKEMRKTFPQCNMDYWIPYWTFIILHVTCVCEKKLQNKVELSKTKGFARLGHESWIYKALEIAWLCIGLVRP